MNPTDTAALPDVANIGLHGAPDMSMLGLFLQADWVVKAVMIALALASVICWAIIVEKSLLLGRLRREVTQLVAAAAPAGQSGLAAPQGEGVAARVLRAGTREWRDGREQGESRFEYRHRMEHAMRHVLSIELRRVEPGLPFLATTGAVAPFIGLFGTVWGIMNSFAGIAQSNDTSLAVVAPGIAEALFATAIGLIAAIPAVMAYNRLLVRLGRLRQDGQAAAADLAAGLSRRPPALAGARASAAAE
ncbi:MotA/TolQ/ExbB proton channel family protein [Pseudoroseomonas cervicalis]|uniref:MotA/TolQ/ExbB proton channel family protein n=1 Tax=Teichococcus cervicalis TaxID=204525 RepID=UPI0022F1BB42|nr:MotA/TolQ/ExbB proton channel family protein [Pseudoroseomonas cervicalis]WBV41620.1 MotA/TolQ/ExbB proton channel family protein [Pseudoroseomonas cervicalis]